MPPAGDGAKHSGSEFRSGATPIIVDLGKKSRKKVKKLRKGEGPLLAEVSQVMSELQSAGKISASAVPVVIVVREKSDSLFSLLDLK